MQHVRSWVKRREYLFSYKDQSIIRQWIERYWIDFLTPAQFKVLSLVVSRTVGWGKMWETIPMRHFAEGAIRRTFREGQDNPVTRMTFRGSGLSLPTIRRAIQELVEQGFIRRKPHRDTYRYAVAWQRMGTAQDPIVALIDGASGGTELAEEIERLRQAYRDSPRSEGGKAAFPRSSKQQHSPNGEFKTPPTGESCARTRESETIARLGGCRNLAAADIPEGQQRNDPMSLPPRRAAKTSRTASQDSDCADAPTPETWKDQPRRVATAVVADEASREVIHAARKKLDAEITGPLTQEYTDRLLGELSSERRKKALAGKETVDKMATLWVPAVFRATGQKPTPWSIKHRGQIERVLRGLELPEKIIRWGHILEWVGERYGEAVALAVPFMLRDEAKRADILHKTPAITLFLAFPDHFATAFVNRNFGDGFSPGVWAFADAAQVEHDHAMERQTIAKRQGHSAIPASHMSVKEIVDHAERMAESDPEIRRLVAERAALQAIAAATKGAGAARQKRADDAVRTARAVLSVERGRDARDAMADNLGIATFSDDPDDYFNAE